MTWMSWMTALTCMGLALGACGGTLDEEPDDDDEGWSEEQPATSSGSCDGFREGTVGESSFYTAATVPYGATCQIATAPCTCIGGAWSCQGAGSDTCEVLCPSGATRVGGTAQAPVCQCAPGFDLEPTGCVAGCPANSTYDATQNACICDAHHFANAQGNACVPGDDLCPSNSHYDAQPDGELHCRCDDGFVANSAGDACVPEPADCPDGNPKAVINGQVVLCCPANATGVMLSGGVWSCNCAPGDTYDPVANTCS